MKSMIRTTTIALALALGLNSAIVTNSHAAQTDRHTQQMNTIVNESIQRMQRQESNNRILMDQRRSYHR